MEKIVLCGRPNRCCPEVWLDDSNVYITDDNAGAVQITREQFNILKQKILDGEI